jgi:hypothetical protein
VHTYTLCLCSRSRKKAQGEPLPEDRPRGGSGGRADRACNEVSDNHERIVGLSVNLLLYRHLLTFLDLDLEFLREGLSEPGQ